MYIKDRLKKVMGQLKLKSVDFSKKTDIPYQTVMKYVNGQRQPTTENLQKMAIHLGVNLTWLLTGEGEMFKSDKPAKSNAMPSEFIDRLKEDLHGKDDSFYALLSIGKDKLFDVVTGTKRLTRLEVIELARKLNKSLDEYIFLSGYLPPEFNKALAHGSVRSLLRSVGNIPDKDIDNLMTKITEFLREQIEIEKKKK